MCAARRNDACIRRIGISGKSRIEGRKSEQSTSDRLQQEVIDRGSRRAFGQFGQEFLADRLNCSPVDRPFDGYQQAQVYRFRRSEDDPGDPITLMRPRALMVPPGVPDFMSRRRFVEPGVYRLEGRAWSGAA